MVFGWFWVDFEGVSRLMSLMSRVWEANLPSDDAKLLQLAEFQVLAVTPDAGYAPWAETARCSSKRP